MFKSLSLNFVYKFTHQYSKNKIQFNLITKQRILFSSVLQYEPSRKSSFYKHNYTPEVEKVINKQIKIEQQAAQDYLSLAVHFLNPSIARPGIGGFLMLMHQEELGHMYHFINYQLKRGAPVQLCSIDIPKTDTNLTLKSAFGKALLMEQNVTRMLENVIQVASNAGDHHCLEFIVSKFLNEQVNSINEITHHITKLNRLTEESSIFIYDQELAKTYPWNFKT